MSLTPPLPVARSGAAPAATETARILLVEDDPNSVFIFKKILAHGHHEILGVAHSGEEACQMAREMKPDLLLMDINIPGAYDGVEAARRIVHERELPVIYLTASSDEATIERARGTAPFAYLLKPLREKEVLITIQMALYKARLDQRGKASEQRLAATLGALADYVLTTDSAGRVTYLNPAAERALGKSAASCMGRSLGELLDLRERETQTRLPDIAERVLQPGFQTDPSHPLLLMRPKGDAQLVHVQTNALTEPGHPTSGRVVILRDITQLNQLEESIRQAQKLEAVGRLAGGIAHDFNNLLAIINSFTDLLLLKSKPGDPFEKYYRNIRTAGQRGADLVARLMTFSRRSPSAPCPVSPADIVGEVVKMIRPLIRENIELVVDAPPQLPQLHTDAGQIEQILVNLCLNARDAISEAGEIIIRMAGRPFDSREAARHNLSGAGMHVMLSVADTGCGIPAELREKIFEPFFTTKEVGKGTGLGLAMVYSLVKQNRGHIEVESEPGAGATFTIYLPAYEAPNKARADTETASGETPGGSERVLLVEDDAHFAECIKSLLDMHGYTTVTAFDGEDGLNRFHEHQGGFDLLLTDMVLPRLSGWNLAEKLLEEQPGLRVMFMTGYENVKPGIGPSPGVDRMEKPFSLNTLLIRVRQLLDQPVKKDEKQSA